VTVYPLGLFGFNGCGYAAVGEGYGIVSADHIKFIPKLKHIYENRYSYRGGEINVKSCI
jgi:hypothetical protein